MKTIFHIITRFDVGGAERVAISIASSESTDCRHHIVELERGHSAFSQQLLNELNAKGIPYHRSWMPVYAHLHYYADRLVALLFPFRFLFLWLKYRPDVVHSHTEIPDMALWLTCKLFPFMHFRIVRTLHNTQLWHGMGWTARRVERLMQQHKANVAISPNVQQSYYDRFGTWPPIIYNGVAPTKQLPYEGVMPGKTNILFAGRFEEQKGIATLCQIIKALKDDDRYHFHVFGSGRQETLFDAMRQQENVTILPPMHGIASVMQSFDYLIMPSLHEGLSILAIEASLNGLPLIINRCAGLYDTLPTDWPLTVDDNNMEQWLRIFHETLPATDRDALVEKARLYANEHFSTKKMQREYELFYNQ